MSSPESLQIQSHEAWTDAGAPELVEHVVLVAEGGHTVAEVEIHELGIVRGDEEFSKLYARRVGFGALRVVERLVTPPLRDKDEIEKAAIRAAEELLV